MRILPTDRVDIAARREHRREEGNLRLQGRRGVHHGSRAIEDPRLRRAWRARFGRRELQQPQQPYVLGPESSHLARSPASSRSRDMPGTGSSPFASGSTGMIERWVISRPGGSNAVTKTLTSSSRGTVRRPAGSSRSLRAVSRTDCRSDPKPSSTNEEAASVTVLIPPDPARQPPKPTSDDAAAHPDARAAPRTDDLRTPQPARCRP
jgi:hypothetical protein